MVAEDLAPGSVWFSFDGEDGWAQLASWSRGWQEGMQVQALCLPTFLQPRAQSGEWGLAPFPPVSDLRLPWSTQVTCCSHWCKSERVQGTQDRPLQEGPGPAVPSGSLLKILIDTHKCFLYQLTSYRSERPVFHTCTDPCCCLPTR